MRCSLTPFVLLCCCASTALCFDFGLSLFGGGSVATREESAGARELEVLKQSFNHADCANRALLQLRSTCEAMDDEERRRLAILLNNCHFRGSGRSPRPCDVSMSVQECVKAAETDPEFFQSYTSFYHQIQGICNHLAMVHFQKLSGQRVNDLMQQTAHTVETLQGVEKRTQGIGEHLRESHAETVKIHESLRGYHAQRVKEMQQQRELLEKQAESLSDAFRAQGARLAEARNLLLEHRDLATQHQLALDRVGNTTSTIDQGVSKSLANQVELLVQQKALESVTADVVAQQQALALQIGNLRKIHDELAARQRELAQNTVHLREEQTKQFQSLQERAEHIHSGVDAAVKGQDLLLARQQAAAAALETLQDRSNATLSGIQNALELQHAALEGQEKLVSSLDSLHVQHKTLHDHVNQGLESQVELLRGQRQLRDGQTQLGSAVAASVELGKQLNQNQEAAHAKLVELRTAQEESFVASEKHLDQILEKSRGIEEFVTSNYERIHTFLRSILDGVDTVATLQSSLMSEFFSMQSVAVYVLALFLILALTSTAITSRCRFGLILVWGFSFLTEITVIRMRETMFSLFALDQDIATLQMAQSIVRRLFAMIGLLHMARAVLRARDDRADQVHREREMESLYADLREFLREELGKRHLARLSPKPSIATSVAGDDEVSESEDQSYAPSAVSSAASSATSSPRQPHSTSTVAESCSSITASEIAALQSMATPAKGTPVATGIETQPTPSKRYNFRPRRRTDNATHSSFSETASEFERQFT